MSTQGIVQDVVSKSRALFQEDQLDEALLQELQARWEAKLRSASKKRKAPKQQVPVSRPMKVPKQEVRPESVSNGDNDDDLDDDEEINEIVRNHDDEDVDTSCVGLFEKVSRVKNRWKCVLKDVVLIMDNKDRFYSQVTGDFQF